MDAAELKDDDLHDKRMARLTRERQEKADMRTEIDQLREALVACRDQDCGECCCHQIAHDALGRDRQSGAPK